MNDRTRCVPLHVNQRNVTTPFGLIGCDENALTFALGYTFQQCLPLLQWFLRQIGVQGVQTRALRNVRIDLQKHHRGHSLHGVTDIEIHLPGSFHIIIEAKIGFSVPTNEQCQKYLPRLDETDEPVQKIVALVQSTDDQFADNYAKADRRFADRILSFSWQQFLTECVRILTGNTVEADGRLWVNYFYRFLDQEYGMKAFTTEVWILAINTDPMWHNGKSHWDIHQEFRVWWDYKEHTVRPLYLAFRVYGEVKFIWRVNQIDHGVPIIDVVPEMKNINKPWPNEPCTIWHLDAPVQLPKAVRTGRGMYNRRVRSDLDLLLSCNTVQEIEAAMGERRDAR